MSEEQSVIAPEWRAENEPVPYPFADTATLRNGVVFIPAELLLDAVLYPIGGSTELYLTKISVDNDIATLYIGDTSNQELMSGSFPLGTPPDNLALADQYGRPAGLLVSEAIRLSFFQGWTAGTQVFQIEQTSFATTCVIPMPDVGVRGFVLEDGSVMLGDVWFLGDDGVILTPLTVVAQGEGVDHTPHNVIRIDVVGDPLFRRRLCDTVFVTPKFVQRITVRQGNRVFSCTPDELGDFKFTAGNQLANNTVLRIRPVPGRGIKIETVGQKLGT